MSFVYALVFAFILFSDALGFIPGIKYWDEAAIVIASVFAIILRDGKLRINRETKINGSILSMLIFAGLFGNIIHWGIQENKIAIFKDIIAFLKFPILMILLRQVGYLYQNNPQKQEKVIHIASLVSRFFVISAFLGLFAGKIFNLGFYINEVRFFLCYKFCFTHPTFLVSSLVFSIVVLFADGKEKNIRYIILACIPLFMAQRFKGYAFLVFTLLFVFVKQKRIEKLFSFKLNTRIKNKYIFPLAFIVCVVMYLVFRKRFSTYLSWGMTSARIALYVVGIQILIDMFPIGSGFGTFASYLSGKYYSSIYYTYGIYDVDGLRPSAYNFISDTQWPWVYGQLGIIGAIGYIALLLCFFTGQLHCLKKYDHIVAFILMWIYIIVAGSMEAYLTNSSGAAVAIVLMVFIGTDKKNYNKFI